jgi:hypothetical protein
MHFHAVLFGKQHESWSKQHNGKVRELRGNEKLDEYLQRILISPQEELIVAFGTTAKTKNGLLFLVEDIGLADETFITRSIIGLTWDARLTAQWIRKAEVSGKGITLIHAHPFRGKVGFSHTDSATKERILPHFNRYLTQSASGYVVVGLNDFSGHYIFQNSNYTLDAIRSVGCPLLKRERGKRSYFSSPFHHRQELSLGKAANKKLHHSVVALVGLGGAGSMVAQELAHLKVGKVILVDGDTLEDSNISRVVGSRKADIGTFKTDITERMIKSIDPEIKVIKITNFSPRLTYITYLKQPM